MLNIDIIKTMAQVNCWTFLCYQENIGMISFTKEDRRINIYLTKGTVATCLNHPKKGKTQLFRKRCNLSDVENIFKNPRIHTRKGYYTK